MRLGETGSGDPIQRLLAGAPVHRRPEKRRDCPNEDDLRLLVPGLVDPGEAEELLAHAAECDWCGTILREAARDLAEPPTDAEEQIAGRTKWADPRRRKELAKRLAAPMLHERRRAVWWWWPAAAGFATAMLVGGVGYEQWARGAGHTGTLLAEAYTAHRQMDVRLPGAAYARKDTVMSGETSSLSLPAPLFEAIPKIQRGIQAHPDDPRWLQLMGTEYLIEGKEPAAIQELLRARSLKPEDPAILADLGAAYFQKAAKGGDEPEAYQAAFEVFSQGASLRPDDPVLAFDLALAAQQIKTPDVAREKWEHYLKLDPDGGWASEARGYLDALKKNLPGSKPTPAPQAVTH